jgi:hypothetical protein
VLSTAHSSSFGPQDWFTGFHLLTAPLHSLHKGKFRQNDEFTNLKPIALRAR